MKLGKHGLPLRSAVIAQRRRRLRMLAALAALAVVGFIGAVAHEIWPQRAEVAADVAEVFTAPPAAEVTLASLPASERPVYRYSIVPGGAYSRGEVADAIQNDAVVAAHYEDIDVDKVHTKTVAAERAVYVSYRVGDKVYWTKNRVRLKAGETLLTDGATEIRSRCGNLVSDNAQQPVAAEEPPLTALDDTAPGDETGSSTIAGERGDEGRLSHVPYSTLASSVAFGGMETPPGVAGTPGMPLGLGGGGGGGIPPYLGANIATNGTSLVAPLGGTERPNHGGGSNGGGSNGGGSNGGGSNGGGSNGGGSNGGGSNGGGSNGGGEQPPSYVPPTTTGGINPETTTTTGGPVTTTTGSLGDGTTGFVDTDTTGSVDIDTTGAGDGAGTGSTGGTTDGEVPTVPEPGTLVLFGLAAIGAAARAVRARSKSGH